MRVSSCADFPRAAGLRCAWRREAGLGLRCGEALPVIAFAVGAGNEKCVTSIIYYSFWLLTNFGAPRNLGAAFRRLKIPTTIVVGSADEFI